MVRQRITLLYKKIVEPRGVRVMQFLVYAALTIGGASVYLRRPAVLEDIVGESLVILFASFITIGSVLGLGSVLQGFWWVERVGLILLITGMLMLFVMVESLQAAQFSGGIAWAFIFTFIQRWTEIRGSQLAPRKE